MTKLGLHLRSTFIITYDQIYLKENGHNKKVDFGYGLRLQYENKEKLKQQWLQSL